jgi:hypothetical protein
MIGSHAVPTRPLSCADRAAWLSPTQRRQDNLDGMAETSTQRRVSRLWTRAGRSVRPHHQRGTWWQSRRRQPGTNSMALPTAPTLALPADATAMTDEDDVTDATDDDVDISITHSHNTLHCVTATSLQLTQSNKRNCCNIINVKQSQRLDGHNVGWSTNNPTDVTTPHLWAPPHLDTPHIGAPTLWAPPKCDTPEYDTPPPLASSEPHPPCWATRCLRRTATSRVRTR